MIFKPEIIAVLSVVTSPAPHLALTLDRDSPNPFHRDPAKYSEGGSSSIKFPKMVFLYKCDRRVQRTSV